MKSQSQTGKLRDLVSFRTGKLDSNAAVPNGAYPFFTCSQETLRTNTFAFDSECVLLAGNNANGIYPLKYFHGKFDAYQRTYVITTRDPNRLTTKFLYYALRPKLLEFRDISTGAATKFLTLTILNDTTIQVPPLPVQRRIAGILSAYDDLIENNLRRIRILEEMARSLYREWFVKFRFPGHEKVSLFDSSLGPIPKGWEAKRLGDVTDLRWGDTSTTKASYVEEGYSAYSASGLDGKLDHYDFDRKGVVLSAIGANCGKTWLAHGKWSCIKNTIRFWSTDDRVSTEYLYIATSNADYWPRRGAAQPFISQGDAERTLLICPDTLTMARFTDFVDPALQQIAVLTASNANLHRTRELLLPRLLSGTINVFGSDSLDFYGSDERTSVEPTVTIKVGSNRSTSSPSDFLASDKRAPTAGVTTILSSHGSAQKRSGNQFELAYELPPSIDQTDRSDVLAVIRQVFSDGQPRPRENAIREVAQALGYGRVGHRITDVLQTDLLTAVRRGILDNVEGELILLARSIADYDSDLLKRQFLAAIGRSWIDCDVAIQNFRRWMGFCRTGPVIEEAARSLIQELLRESRLEVHGPNLIRRNS